MPDKNSREECAKEFLRATRKAVPKMMEEIEKRVKMGETEVESLTVFTNELIDIAKKTEKEVRDVPVSCFNCPLGNQHNGNPCTFSSPGLCKEVQNAICDLFEGKVQNWFGFRSKDVEMFEQEK